MAIMKMDEWQGGSGLWYCADTTDLGHDSAYWYHAPAALGISGDTFVQKLVNEFHCDHISYNKERDVLVYAWTKQADMRKFKNYINKIFRDVKYSL